MTASTGSGVGWIAQRAPVKRSASVTAVPSGLVDTPTAVHEFRDAQLTPSRLLVDAPSGLGVGWITQRAPSKRSASDLVVPSTLVKNPTAVHEFDDGHDTPLSTL